MIKIGKMVLGSFATNCYFVYEEDKKEALVFDPADRGAFIYDKLTGNGFGIAGIYITHGHMDHIGGAKELQQLSGAKIHALGGADKICEDTTLNLSVMFGKAYALKPDVYLTDGEVCREAGMEFRVIAAPGHTTDGCCYYFEEAGFLIGGDTLFLESVGRTDFPTGSASLLVRSIKEKLFALPDDTKVFSGHGDATDIGHEKQYNPFVQ